MVIDGILTNHLNEFQRKLISQSLRCLSGEHPKQPSATSAFVTSQMSYHYCAVVAGRRPGSSPSSAKGNLYSHRLSFTLGSVNFLGRTINFWTYHVTCTRYIYFFCKQTSKLMFKMKRISPQKHSVQPRVLNGAPG